MDRREAAERRKRSLTTKELVTMALLSALLLIGQVAMSFLPNIEIVSLLVYIYAQIYRKKAFLIVYVFVLLEGCIYGFGIWWMTYLYLWSVLVIAVLLTQKRPASLPVSLIILGAYGLGFGALCAIPYLITGGWAAGFSYWVAGIPFDLLHCGGNIAVALILYRPMHKAVEKLAAGSVS